MKKISVVVASSINFSNSGMFSVDYSAYRFFKYNFHECELKFYVFHLSDEEYYKHQALMPYSIYNVIGEKNNLERLLLSDLIVYWGDFFHTRHFLEGYMENYQIKGNKSKLDLFYRSFFLEYLYPELYEKVIIFGNSLMFNGHDAFQKTDRYSRAFFNLYCKVKYIAPRDKISRENLKSVRIYSEQGCDAAFLLGEQSYCYKENKIGLFIGRRTEIRIRDIFEIIKFSRETGFEIKWIDWMLNNESFFKRAIKNPKQAKNLFLHFILSKIFKNNKIKYENDFTSLSRYNIIVTDTYHLAINAIKENVPVFCIGNNKTIYNRNDPEYHDLKKEIIFEYIDNLGSYGMPSNKKLKQAMQYNYSKSEYKKEINIIHRNLVTKIREILYGE